MPSERERDSVDDENESSKASEIDDNEATASATDESRSDDDDFDDEDSAPPDDGRLIPSAPDAAQSMEEVPRNRSERRAKKKRDVRPAREDRNSAALTAKAAAAGITADSRAKLPPRTSSGKSSADEVPPWAKGIVAALQKNVKTIAMVATVIVVVLGASVGWMFLHRDKLAKAARSYSEAMAIAVAPIRAADAPADPPSAPPRHGPTYTDRTARSQAALRAFHAVSEQYPDAPVAPLAKLSEAGILYDLGRYADARTAYQSLVGKDVAGQEGRVLEGLGFTLEALHDNAGALTQYQALGQIQEGSWRDIAVFHQARVEQSLGHGPRAKDLLHGLIARLQHASQPNDDQSSAGGSGSILEQAQALLHDIDPADPLAQRIQSGGPLDRDALMRMLQQRGLRTAPGGGLPSAPPAPGH